MKPGLKNAAVDFFDACTTAERVEAFVFMSALISARDITHVSYAPNEGIGTDDLLRLFDACSFEEKLRTFSFIIDKWIDGSEKIKSAPATGANDPMKQIMQRLRTITQDEKQLIEFFELCTPFERKEAYKMIRDFIASYANLQPLSDLSNKDVTVEKMYQAFAACNFDHQVDVFFFIIEKWNNSLMELKTITKADEARAGKIKELYFFVQNENIAPLKKLTVPAFPGKRKRTR